MAVVRPLRLAAVRGYITRHYSYLLSSEHTTRITTQGNKTPSCKIYIYMYADLVCGLHKASICDGSKSDLRGFADLWMY
jgi:hypothetical protein